MFDRLTQYQVDKIPEFIGKGPTKSTTHVSRKTRFQVDLSTIKSLWTAFVLKGEELA